jgi:hypothetical protein
MKKFIICFLSFFISIFTYGSALTLTTFTVPDGWEQVRHISPKETVKILVRQPRAEILPPSINLVVEKVDVSLPEYLQVVKSLHKYINNAELHDLGKINTKAGSAHLISIEMTSNWGDTKILQAMTIRDNIAYVITATALKNDFSVYYKDFFNAIKSFEILENVFQSHPDLMKKYSETKEKWLYTYIETKKMYSHLSEKDLANKAFYDKKFQQEHWHPLTDTIQISFTEIQRIWQDKIIEQLRQECLEYRG